MIAGEATESEAYQELRQIITNIGNSTEAAKLEQKVGKSGKFDLEDFLTAMKQIKRMGPLEGLLGMLPGVGKELKGVEIEPDRMKQCHERPCVEQPRFHRP